MTSKNIRTDALDFSEIKENLKEFLRGQSEFTDYDFDGSAMSILLDVLAYNTHYNSLYTNLAVNEMFLDSANKYSSVVSLAKTLGYTAKSVTSATAKLNITITTAAGLGTFLLPAGTVFRASVGEEDFDFVTKTDVSAQVYNTGDLTTGVFRFFDVEVVEGSRLTKKYTVSPNGNQFVIPNKSADTSSLMVKVQENASSSNYQAFSGEMNFLSIGSEDTAFFVRQREDLYYEVYFGNGTIGKALSPGNVVHISYLVSNGNAANGATGFSYASGISTAFNTITVNSSTSAVGGSPIEDIDSIRFNAPRAYASQNRAVTAEDYKNIIYTNYPSIETISTWGGQDNSPPIYGKVFIAAKPYGSDKLTNLEKETITAFLKKTRGVVAVTPVLVDPKFLRIELTSSVNYDPAMARRTAGEIQEAVKNTVLGYANSLGKFGSAFRLSKVSSLIDRIDDSIVSNSTSFRIRSSFMPYYNKNARYLLKMDNPIYKNPYGGSLYTTRFYTPAVDTRCYLTDDGEGNVYLYSENVDASVERLSKVGTIDYTSGQVDVEGLNVSGLYDEMFEFVVVPENKDVIPTREHIIQLPESLITVNMKVDSEK